MELRIKETAIIINDMTSIPFDRCLEIATEISSRISEVLKVKNRENEENDSEFLNEKVFVIKTSGKWIGCIPPQTFYKNKIPENYIECRGQSFELIRETCPDLVKILKSSGYDKVPDTRGRYLQGDVNEKTDSERGEYHPTTEGNEE